MGADTKIEWTDHTFNAWWGCQRVSPGCEHCYAEAFSKRVGGSPWAKGLHWGPGGLRTPASEKQWGEPRKWHAAAAKAGVRARVFCASMADVFEDRRDLDKPRERLFKLIDSTPWLDWQLLTKRPENMQRLVPAGWAQEWPRNVWAGCTVEDQRRADERIPHLLRVPAVVRFLSCEPLLESIDIDRVGLLWARCAACDGRGGVFVVGGGKPCPACLDHQGLQNAGIDWVIVGGESGGGARPFDLAWARSIVAQCKAAEVPVFLKQLGARPVVERTSLGPGALPLKLINGKGGIEAEWPEDLQGLRAFPESR